MKWKKKREKQKSGKWEIVELVLDCLEPLFLLVRFIIRFIIKIVQ
jgi:hypothetical protein